MCMLYGKKDDNKIFCENHCNTFANNFDLSVRQYTIKFLVKQRTRVLSGPSKSALYLSFILPPSGTLMERQAEHCFTVVVPSPFFITCKDKGTK